jgi:gas vesicle protein
METKAVYRTTTRLWAALQLSSKKGIRHMDDDNKISYFFLGIGLGAAVGLLFAPKAGSETRDLLMAKADEGKDYLRRRGEELRDSAGDLVDKGKDAMARQRDQVNAAMEAGKQAYREAVGSPGPEPTA